MLRWLVGAASVFVIGAATHANVMHMGGYGTPSAWVCVGLALLLAVAFGFAMVLWTDGQRVGATAIVLSMCCGEAYWLLTNADREMADRAAIATPILKQQKAWEDASRRVLKAEDTKRTADDAVISEAAKPGCKTVCADMLAEAQASADKELREARAALTVLPLPPPVSSVAAVWEVSQAKWDLFLAVLRSVAIGGASLALGYALRTAMPRRLVRTATPASREWAAQTTATVSRRRTRRPNPNRFDDELEHVAEFLKATLQPDPEATASLKLLHARYVDWCGEQQYDPLPPKVLGTKLRSVVDALGLPCEQAAADLIVRGATIKEVA